MRGMEHAVRAAALGTLLCCLFLPVANPDIFWHLSAAGRMAELGAIPRSDWLSSTMAGSPWTDFEWLTQLLFGVLHGLGGMAALWLLKAVLIGASAAVLWATLRLHRVPGPWRWPALALWSAATLARADARPELSSALGFGLAFYALERRRLGKGTVPAYWAAPFFCLWANLHAGFAYGLLLVGLYATGEFLQARTSLAGRAPSGPRVEGTLWPQLACGALGTMAQPFGSSYFQVLWSHWQDIDALSVFILEWGGIRLDNPWHWPYWVLLLAGFGAALAFVRRRRFVEPGPLAALLWFGWSASQHARLGAYYSTLVLPLAMGWALRSQILPEVPGPRARRLSAALAVLCAAYSFHWGRKFGLFEKIFHDRFVPLRAAEFLAREKGALGDRILYNPWGWGGYLGWRLQPDYKVFQDGRYIFHPLLLEAAGAVEDPAAWQAFLDSRKVEVVVLENIPLPVETRKANPDGSFQDIVRPYYAVYMPREAWAIVHWDAKALVFVRRASFEGKWLKAREYRWAKPFDDEARAEALRVGEIPKDALDAELRRHDAEESDLAALPIRL